MASSEPGARMLLRLSGIDYGARGINIYRFSTQDGSALPAFEPGAHIDIDVAPGMTRQYSLLWPPAAADSYGIAVQEASNGRGGSTAWHRQSVVGELYALSAPRNHFPLMPLPQRPIVLLAGGIGITPIISMYRKLKAAAHPVTLHYWSRSAADALFRDELAHSADGSVHLYHMDQTPDAPMLDDLIGPALAEAQLYCCGPAPMLDAFDRLTAAYAPGLAHRERFAAAPMAAPASRAHFQVRLARSELTLSIGPGQSVLAACLAAGVDVAYSCEEGICGACEVKVLAGSVQHRDQVLPAAAHARSEVMMVCCSRGITDLVLDL